MMLGMSQLLSIHSPVVLLITSHSPAHGDFESRVAGDSISDVLGLSSREVLAFVSLLWLSRIEPADGTLLVDLQQTITLQDGTQEAFRPRSLDPSDLAAEARRLSRAAEVVQRELADA